MAFINQQEILDKTNGGLDIIVDFYPQARDAVGSKKGFSIRNEDAPSAHLKCQADGNWVVTDFGDDSVPRNGILVCIKEMNLSFKGALDYLAGRYGVNGKEMELFKPEIERTPVGEDDNPGDYKLDHKDRLTVNELRMLGPVVDQAICNKYNVTALKSYSFVKKDEETGKSEWMHIYSTDNYPIYCFDHGKFKKVYSPLGKKQYRFRYFGKRPKDFINGYLQCKLAYDEYKQEQLQEADDDEKKKEVKIKKLPEILICSGERDSLCAAAFGYPVVWFNSETYFLLSEDFKKLKNLAERIINIPDIDATGRKAGIKLSTAYLDICIAWLPSDLLTLKDNRGYPRKDLKDYIEVIHPKDFGKTKKDPEKARKEFEKTRKKFNALIKKDAALPFRFWDVKKSENSIEYVFNNEHAFHFLECQGFGRYMRHRERLFVKVDGNIVSEIEPDYVKSYIRSFLEERAFPVPLRNMVHRNRQLGIESLKVLRPMELDFKSYGPDFQYFFFENENWKITAKKIEKQTRQECPVYCWDDKVVAHQVKRLEPSFKVTQKEGYYDIDVKSTESKYFSYLINTSRIHWQQELENNLEGKSPEEKEEYRKENKFNIAGPNLTEEQRLEQKQHLVNKIFAIGYLLHRYKNKAKPWAVYAMDNAVMTSGEAHGGSGKSCFLENLSVLIKREDVSGKNKKNKDNAHFLENVTEFTDYVFVDDVDKYFSMDEYFDKITGSLQVNVKQVKSFNILFEKSPKFCFTSNFIPRNTSPSSDRRTLYCVFSDYYHQKSIKNSFEETRTIADDFGGKQIMADEYTEAEWNADINFMAECLQFYLSATEKIDPPMDNITKKILLAEMESTNGFKDWADAIFDRDSNFVDQKIMKSEITELYKAEFNSQKNKNAGTALKKSLKAWCEYTDYVIDLNPKGHFKFNEGRIMQYSKRTKKNEEFFYIQTKEEVDVNAEFIPGDESKPF